jgi:hypothetical protein
MSKLAPPQSSFECEVLKGTFPISVNQDLRITSGLLVIQKEL